MPAKRHAADLQEFSAAEITALAHLYRGEVYRSTIWRTRLDTTTNWSVVTLGVALGGHGRVLRGGDAREDAPRSPAGQAGAGARTGRGRGSSGPVISCGLGRKRPFLSRQSWLSSYKGLLGTELWAETAEVLGEFCP